MPGDSNGTIAAARQRTQIRRHMRHGDTNGATACVISDQQRHHRGRGARLASPHLTPLRSRYLRQDQTQGG
jgi:hypothetical protein